MRMTLSEEMNNYLRHPVVYIGDCSKYWYFVDEIMERFLRVNKTTDEIGERWFDDAENWQLLGFINQNPIGTE